MSDYQEFTGKSVEEALRAARDAFGVVGLDDLDFEILTPGSRGVLGMGAEPARIVAAPRAALGGAAPRRAAAEATPLPPPPPRPERERDRPPRRDDRGRQDRDRARRPEERAPEQVARPEGEPVARPEGESRPPREPSTGARRDERGHGRGERRTATLTPGEQDQVAAARSSLSLEREEIQAVEASPEALEAGRAILERLMALMGYDVEVRVVDGTTAKLNVLGEGEEREALGALIGRKGERLSALQHLVNLMLSHQMGAWTRVLVDVEDYRGRRERQLVEIANRAADRVIETGKMLQLEPMPPLERRWIHLALREREGVATQSIGEEPNRRVVVLRVEG
ncbi:MAG: RNA-binding cell elongation regulator Jag/EloR [Candidatus Limnocylindrales bacterium]